VSFQNYENKSKRNSKKPAKVSGRFIKKQDGKDIVMYGGAIFVSSLINYHLIDELNLFLKSYGNW